MLFSFRKFYLVLLSLFILSSCEDQVRSYELTGVLKGVPDNSTVYISASNIIIDSTNVINGKFSFSGEIDKPTNVYLKVKETMDIKSFWLENERIMFKANKGDFRAAKITGSKTQEDQNELLNRLKDVYSRLDVLDKLYEKNTTSKYLDSLDKQYDLVEKKEAKIYQNYIKEFPNSLVSAHSLNIYASTWGKETTIELFSLLSKANRDSDQGKKISEFIQLNQELKIGDHFIDFEMANQNGINKKLSNTKGKVVLLEFWASWCAPCRKESPKLVKTYKRFKTKGFEIFAVSLDKDKYNWLKAIRDDNLIWTHVSELNGDDNKAGLIYGVNVIPDNFLIDESGNIIGRDLRGENLVRKLEEILN